MIEIRIVECRGEDPTKSVKGFTEMMAAEGWQLLKVQAIFGRTKSASSPFTLFEEPIPVATKVIEGEVWEEIKDGDIP